MASECFKRSMAWRRLHRIPPPGTARTQGVSGEQRDGPAAVPCRALLTHTFKKVPGMWKSPTSTMVSGVFFKGMGFSISILLCCAQLGHRKTRETAICCLSWFRSANWPNQPSTWSFSFAPGHASEELWNAWSQCFFVPWFWWYLELESRDFPCLKQLWPFFSTT